MNTERDNFLTEAMGDCWHEWTEDLDEYTDFTCLKCGKQVFDIEVANTDFSTWEGFGKLWEWSQKQDWCIDFLLSIDCLSFALDIYFVNPDRFADAVCKYLKEGENK